jgi:hypothetical protein
MAKHGDAKLLYLIDDIADCPKAKSANMRDRCKARYDGLKTR